MQFRMFTGRDRYNEPAGIVCFVSITSGLTEIAGEYAFTSREMGILMLVIKGFSNSEIAETLDLFPGTVKIHVHNIYSRTGTKNMVELSRIMN